MPHPDPKPRRGGDQIYQLSLTELAFILIFLLLVLAGWIVFRSEHQRLTAVAERDAARAEAARQGAKNALPGVDAEIARQALEALNRLLTDTRGQNPNDVVSDLVRRSGAEAENRQLRQRIENLDAQLSALVEVKKVLDRSVPEADSTGGSGGEPSAGGREALRDEIASALRFQAAVESQTGKKPERGREADLAKALTEALRQFNEMQKTGEGSLQALQTQNRDLQGRVDYLRNQLGSRGGRDYPPCWAEEGSGKVQFLFTVELRDSGLAIAPAWPAAREADARILPGVDGLTGGGILPIGQFRLRAKAIDIDSRAKNCRHYVRLVNRVRSLEIFNRHRYAVEEYFYKLEVR